MENPCESVKVFHNFKEQEPQMDAYYYRKITMGSVIIALTVS